eukprot:Ihof_evm1s536 gene=Ihof_evmTU1s536
MPTISSILGLLALSAYVVADLPIDCTRREVEGDWIIYHSEKTFFKPINCTNFDLDGRISELHLRLTYPDVVVGPEGQLGHWTMVYNEGMEIRYEGNMFYAYFNYYPVPNTKDTISMCGQTKEASYHSFEVKNWGCFKARRADKADAEKEKMNIPEPIPGPVNAFTNGLTDYQRWRIRQRLSGLPSTMGNAKADFVKTINTVQTSWVAGEYDDNTMAVIDESLTTGSHALREFHTKFGSKMSFLRKANKLYNHLAKNSKTDLPESFDWRNVSGVNYVSPVRDQASCGSCYAFASTGVLEARWRIFTKNREQPIFSVQDIVSCSPVAQGCAGGFSFLTAGKYAHDTGMIEEHCHPYVAKDEPCPLNTPKTCRKFHTSDYYYIGGYFGASNEVNMMTELLTNGPIAVGIEVFSDFRTYKSGVYHYTGTQAKHGQLIPEKGIITTNHAVTIVGYGVENNEKYWLVK